MRYETEADDVRRAVFFGLGSDGTVSANRSSVRIVGEATPQHVQAYFVYDSKKSGSVTVSHLRFSPRPLRSHYLVRKAGFVACHQFSLLGRPDTLEIAAPGATLLLNAPHPPDAIWAHLPSEVRSAIVEKGLRLHVIDAYGLAASAGLGGRISTIMQACFFALSGILPPREAIGRIEEQIRRIYRKKGEEIVRRNIAAIGEALQHLHAVPIPADAAADPAGAWRRPPAVPAQAPEFVRRVTAALMEGRGDRLPVSAFPVDGTWPTGTGRWEKRNIAQSIPEWDPAICIQCNKCAFVCPHAAIRAKVFPPEALAGAPETFRSIGYRGHEFAGFDYGLQVAPEDCTGCGLCVAICPARDKSNPRHKAIDMAPLAPLREAERANFDFFLSLPEADRKRVRIDVKGSQFLEPLFEFSGACAGCGETPYLKLLTQLVGDRLLVANATGCSSIYGGNLPTTPWSANREGRGPAWSNSLFEDNAEFGLGFRLALDRLTDQARTLTRALSGALGDVLVDGLLREEPIEEAWIEAQRGRVAELKARLSALAGGARGAEASRLATMADLLVPRSVWIVGGDGWAYDIGYGGLDHVLALGEKVNLLVLDTEVYSNTGGQQSKATPMGAAAKFAAAGKGKPKKDLGLLAMTYGSVYVARIAFGAKDTQTLKAFQEAESFPGTSLLIAYSPCIAHGYDLSRGGEQQKLAVESGHWPLFRFDPRRVDLGESPLQLDSPAPKGDLDRYTRNETRYLMVERQDPERFRRLMAEAGREARRRRALYEKLVAAMAPEKSGAAAIPR